MTEAKTDPKTDPKTAQTAKRTEANAEKRTDSVRQAAGTWAETMQEAVGTIADSAVAMQDRNLQFAQSIVDRGFSQVERQTAALHELTNKLYSTSPERRAAFRTLAREASAAYLRLLTAPVRYMRRQSDTGASEA
jgi:hypothetical protein